MGVQPVVDDEVFAEFVLGRWYPLRRAALALGCTPSEADDLVQTTLVKCFLAWERVQGADNVDAYVGRMLLHAHRDTFRRRWRREVPTDVLPDRPVGDGVDRLHTSSVVAGALAGLSEGQRRAVALKYYLGLTETESAEVLGVAVGTVKSRLSRALHTLAAHPDLTALDDSETP